MASCPDCVKGTVLPGEPEGQMLKIGQTDAYFTSTSSPSQPKRAVVLFTDIFGLPLKNCKIIADRLAKEVGCDVWVPDLFNGVTLVTVDELKTPSRPGQKRPFTEHLWNLWLMISRFHLLFAIRGARVDPSVIEFINTVKKDKSYEKIGAVGYCFGGSLAIRLGSKDLFDSIVIAHPGKFDIEQAKAINIPCSWACAEEDSSFSKALKHQCEADFKEREGKENYVEYEFVEYPNTTHGFACRPDLAYPDLIESYENCLKQTVSWFEKTL